MRTLRLAPTTSTPLLAVAFALLAAGCAETAPPGDGAEIGAEDGPPASTAVEADPAIVLDASIPATADVFRIDSIAEGVWVAEVIASPAAYAFASSVVVAGDDGLLVVDTQQSPSAAGALIRWLRERFEQPVRWVVNTHFHGDHVNGNSAYRSAWPEVEIVALASVPEAIRPDGLARIQGVLEEIPAVLEERQGWLDSGTGPDGNPLTDAQRERLDYSVRVNRRYVAELRGLAEALERTVPDRTVDAPRTLDHGGRTVQILPVGPAHTVGDLIAWVADVRLAAVGDVLEEAAPWIEGADLHGWAEALAAIRGLEPDHVVASHASASAGPRLLEGEAPLFADLVTAAEAAAVSAAEVSPDERVAAVVAALEPHRDFLQSVGVVDDAFTEWAEAAARQALAEAGAR